MAAMTESHEVQSQIPDDGAGPAGAAPDTTRRWWRLTRASYWVALVVLGLAGVAGQVRVWASDRGLWGDELYVAVNFRSLGIGDLAGPLYHGQVVPPGWLALHRATLKLFGNDEQVLKVPELVAAIAVLVLAAAAAHVAIGRWAALVTAALIATAPQLYYFAGELKQYAFEAGVAMVIMAAGGWYGRAAPERRLPGWRRALVFAAVTAVVSAGSYSALVVLGGVAAAIGLLQLIRRRWLGVLVTAAATLPGVAVGIAQAALRFRLGVPDGQFSFFPHGVAPKNAGFAGTVRWLPEVWHWFVVSPLYWRFSPVALILAVAGLVALVVRRRPLWAAMIAGVFVAALGAGALRAFPLEGRVAVYLIAPIAIAVAAGVDGAVRLLVRAVRRPGGVRRLALGLPAALLLIATVAATTLVVSPAAVGAYHQVGQPRYRDAGRDMLRQVGARIRPGDVVLVYYFSEPLVNWYGRGYGVPLAGMAKLHRQTRAGCDTDQVARTLSGADRLWYVHGASLSRHPAQYQEWVLADLARYGTVIERNENFIGAGWTLFDLRAGPDPAPPPASTDPLYHCLRIEAQPAAFIDR